MVCLPTNHIMEYIEDLDRGVFKSSWSYAKDDLKKMPSGSKTYISDRMSTAIGMLVNEGLVTRKDKGSHYVVAE